MSKKDHNTENPQEKAHHQGIKEMPSSLPNQRISSDGKKMPLSDEEKSETDSSSK